MISIIDNGHGISSDFSKRIFIPFSQQADHLTRNSGGSGLGLAISKSLIELMSGEIGYHSEPNVETTFWVKIPVMS
ncbi:MAG: signal transduction histidine kinase [Loktanella salsilacus]|jgi:signal transduction histidine kinase